MQHSLAARYASRPTARFVRSSPRAPERRLGLRPSGSFSPAPARATVLRRGDLGPLAQLRAGWRAVRPAASRRPAGGLLRRPVVMHWTRFDASGDRPASGAMPASWRA